MRIRQVLVFALVAFFSLVGVAHAGKVVPVIVVNTYVNTTAEQISSSASLKACKQLTICNRSTTNKLVINNSSSVSATNGKTLWPNAGTATVESRCEVFVPDQVATGVATIDGTSFYAVAATGNASATVICLP